MSSPEKIREKARLRKQRQRAREAELIKLSLSEQQKQQLKEIGEHMDLTDLTSGELIKKLISDRWQVMQQYKAIACEKCAGDCGGLFNDEWQCKNHGPKQRQIESELLVQECN